MLKAKKLRPPPSTSLLISDVPFSQNLLENLTRQERKVLRLASEDLTNKEIAELLFVSIETIKSHRKNILRKCNVKGKVAARRFFYKISRVFLDELPPDNPNSP